MNFINVVGQEPEVGNAVNEVFAFDMNTIPITGEEEEWLAFDIQYMQNEAMNEAVIAQTAANAEEEPEDEIDGFEDENTELVVEWLDDDSDAEIESYDWTDSESDSEDPEEIQPQICQEDIERPTKRKCKELSNFERANVADKLQQYSHDNKLPKGKIMMLAAEYDVSRWTIQRIWKEVKRQMEAHENIDVKNLKTGRVGRKRISFNPQDLMLIPLRKRTTIRSVAAALGIHRSTLHRLIKRGAIKKVSNAIKPDLTKAHLLARVMWCLKNIVPGTVRTLPKFCNMYNVVHVDEKWFCMSKITMKYYLAPGEKEPHRKCKSKRFILKIMFIAVVARPLITPAGEVIFDGKIGIFPFTELVAAKRSSKNRAAGTFETKPIKSVTKAVVKAKMMEQILPAIRSKWPSWATKTIWIVQDNAKPHISGDDPDFAEECSKEGFDIKLINQPAQSPDLNVLDLGFFRAIQSLKDQLAPRSVDKLVKAVEQAYLEYDPKLLNHIFLTLQQCMGEIMKIKGNNNYHIPHMNKQSLERRGELPTQITVEQELIEQCTYWVEQGHLDEPEVEQTIDSSSESESDGELDDGVGIL